MFVPNPSHLANGCRRSVKVHQERSKWRGSKCTTSWRGEELGLTAGGRLEWLMPNVLKVSHHEAIRSLHQKGWSERRIARELGINRRTVRRYIEGESKWTSISTPDLVRTRIQNAPPFRSPALRVLLGGNRRFRLPNNGAARASVSPFRPRLIRPQILGRISSGSGDGPERSRCLEEATN